MRHKIGRACGTGPDSTKDRASDSLRVTVNRSMSTMTNNDCTLRSLLGKTSPGHPNPVMNLRFRDRSCIGRDEIARSGDVRSCSTVRSTCADVRAEVSQRMDLTWRKPRRLPSLTQWSVQSRRWRLMGRKALRTDSSKRSSGRMHSSNRNAAAPRSCSAAYVRQHCCFQRTNAARVGVTIIT